MLSVSVIMPVYNGEEYIADAIESILNQTFTDFEFIIINDGSKDKSSEIIKSYSKIDNRIIFIDRVENKQLPYTLNEGLRAANGKYIARMDCDDISVVDRLKIQYDFLENNQDIGIVGGAYAAFNSKGEKKAIIHPVSIFDLTYKFLSDSFFCHPTVMFRKELIENIGYYHEVEAEDFDFFSRMLYVTKGINIPTILLNYRETLNNRSFSAKDKITHSVEAIYKNNYLFYFGSLLFNDVFYRFHKYNRSNIFLVPLNFFISLIIINKIRTNYRFSFMDNEFLSYLHVPIQSYFKITINRIKNKFER
ncbi:MAG: glycosyltransferase [Paludibacter sp.]|nr:glycosyltransferase [Paludibacter sp.]